jgi:hypothetical protein
LKAVARVKVFKRREEERGEKGMRREERSEERDER